MRYRYEANCLIHGTETGNGDTEAECKMNMLEGGKCYIQDWSIYEVNE